MVIGVWCAAVVGADGFLKSNLETFFQLDYPNELLEIIFCVPTAHDSSLPIIAELRNKFPLFHTSVSIGSAAAGVNPKIKNIGKLVWVAVKLDSGTAFLFV